VVALAPLGTAGRIAIGAVAYALTVAVFGPGWKTGPR